eukprot:TRINITY_DN12712_c0_g1_i4.p1 TRINITY_DN12712_c0_g1~~TRINITY_DN12712_c0_g1_i4.p1  ORF type:complete len:197 (+),score=37.80 TRINITY_DN12712_c0_g1_i4:116-706(+)
MSLLLFVSVGESTYPLEVEPMATVGDLQQALGEALGRKAGQLRFQGRMLRPDALLADEGLCQESRLEEEAFVRPVFNIMHHGENAEFREDGREVSRVRDYKGALVFTAAPVVDAGCSSGGFMVQVTETDSQWAGSVSIGLTADVPAKLPRRRFDWLDLERKCGQDLNAQAGNMLACRRREGCGAAGRRRSKVTRCP